MLSTKLKTERLIYLILIATFLKGLIWAAVVPIWHTPDEQAHFANIEFIAEKKRLPDYILFPGIIPEKDLSREILLSEKLLGTERDEAGNNKFTYHPEYNLPYEKGMIGEQEKEIINTPVSWRSEMVKSEPVNYPPLYYLGGTAVYLLFCQSDLFVRVSAVRLFSVLLFVLTVFFTFKIARELFPQDFLWQLAVPILVSFQPMVTFVASGVNSDNLANLLFTVFIYLSLKMINKEMSLRLAVLLGLDTGLGLLTKPQFVILLPIILGLFIYQLVKYHSFSLWKSFLVFIISSFLGGGWWVVRLYFAAGTPLSTGWSTFTNPYSSISLFEYLKNSLARLIRETLPWYWGVFKWLGVTLPRLANQILMRLGVLAALGLIFWLVRLVKERKFGFEEKGILYLFLLNFIYIGALYWVDFSFLKTHGFSIGMQGRYFFPLISTQMLFLALGIWSLFPKKWLRVKKFAIISLCLGMVVLNFVALTTVFSSYYPVQNFSQAIAFISQYKPWFFKGNWFIILSMAYLLNLGVFIKDSLSLIKK